MSFEITYQATCHACGATKGGGGHYVDVRGDK